jgi:hypothetical protein
MDDYQVANLSELLSLITTFGTPLNALASGDWAWEILGALPKVDHRPNQDKATQLKWIYNRLSWDGWVAPSNVGNDPQPLP